MEAENKLLSNEKLFNVGVRLVKFAWAVEILAVTIGFLISIIVSYSVYFELARTEREFNFGDYSNILVAGLPFVLVAVVEASKIPVATAMMYARHTVWRVLLFLGLMLLSVITFETMLNGFERNFSSLNLAIDERKNESLLIQNNIDNLEARKKEINTIDPDQVDQNYNQKVANANANYHDSVQRERTYIERRITSIDSSYKTDYETEIADLHRKEREIYDAWDKERAGLQKRLRSLMNQNLSDVQTDKQKLQDELDDLQLEMKQKLAEASFLTRSQVEEKYRALISEKEKRLYQVSDYSAGTDALKQQTEVEQQLQDQLQTIGKSYQSRLDLIQDRIKKLNNDLNERLKNDEGLRKKYREEFEQFTRYAANNKSGVINRVAEEKQALISEYETIQTEIKGLDLEIFDLKKQQTLIHHDINRLVNSNQIYRLAAYVSNEENAIDVPKSMVGLVALTWFASLAFICAITGVFLAIAGIYIQKAYSAKAEQEMADKTA